MKFGFVTCVQLGLDCMDEIYKVGGKLDLVISLNDELSKKKSGRIYVDAFCKLNQIDTLKVRHINDQNSIQEVRDRGIDWLFIIGWSQIAGPEALVAPKRGVLGMHPTLLPKGRGRASIPWAILKGLDETGVSLFQLDEGVDTGPILAQERLSISPDENATSLYARVCDAHRNLIHRVWPDLEADRIRPLPQDHSQATTWPGRTPEDGRILPEMSVNEVDRLVRATTRPYPGAFWQDGTRIIRIWKGRIANELEPSPEEQVAISLHDGTFLATEHNLEAI